MARKIAIICISLLIFISSGLSVYHTYKVKETMNAIIGQAKISAESGDKEKAARFTKQATVYWKKEEQVLIIFTHHAEIDSLTDVITKLLPLIEHDDLSQFCSELDEALNIIDHIWTMQLPLIQNIL